MNSSAVVCVKCGERAATFYREQRRDGGYHIRCVCQMCGADAIGKPYIHAEDYGLIKDDLPIFVPDHVELIHCEVVGCPNIGAQLHHLAPRNKFNGEADRWPQVYVCHYHHVEWHWKMEHLNLDDAVVQQIIAAEVKV